jgi:hypothetical protein
LSSDADLLARSGLYHINNPQRAMRGKPLGGYINTLMPGNEWLVPTGFNVRFELIEDKIMMDYKRSINFRDYFYARWLAKPENFIMAAVAIRDISAGEELFVDYNRLNNDSDKMTLSSADAAYHPDADRQITWHM